VSVLRWFPI
jgi:hypothetical protein